MDPDAANDTWLDGLSKKDLKKAKEAEEKREEERRRKAMESDAVLTSDSLSTLLLHLETGETPLEALQRLGRSKPKEAKVPKWKQKRLKSKMDIDEPDGAGDPDPVEVARKQAVEAITGAADAIYSREQHEIYETERELLLRQYKRETGEDWKAPIPEDTAMDSAGHDAHGEMWEYRWSDKRDGGESHGPYDGPTMKAWNEAGYFGEGVEYKRTGETEWSRLLDVK
jgi:CD2 antigen cytoplasmic tail-binding protein 2